CQQVAAVLCFPPGGSKLNGYSPCLERVGYGAHTMRLEGARDSALQRGHSLPAFGVPDLGRPMERILVVEDDRAVQKALKRLFEAEGFEVQIGGDGKWALEVDRAEARAA